MGIQKTNNNHRKQKGFTLIELFVTLIIVSILLTIAVPNFNAFMKANLLATTTNKLVTSLNLARSEAINRGGRVTICKSDDGLACKALGNWSQGWIVFTDETNSTPPVFSPPAETLLNVAPQLDPNLNLTGNVNVIDYISFIGSGQSQMTSGGIQMGTISLCDDRAGNFGTSIVLSRTGRVSIVKDQACP